MFTIFQLKDYGRKNLNVAIESSQHDFWLAWWLGTAPFGHAGRDMRCSMERGKEPQQSRRTFLGALGTAATLTGAAQRTGSAQTGNSLRIGLVGTGARGNYLGSTVAKFAIAGEPLELAAVCDIYQPRLERTETKFQAKGCDHMWDMLRETQLDAVIMATPDRHHVPNILETIRAGKDVYCEKPLGHSGNPGGDSALGRGPPRAR